MSFLIPRRFTLLLACALLPGLALAQTPATTNASSGPTMLDNPEVLQFIAKMHEQHGFDSAMLTTSFSNQRPDNRVVRLLAPAPAPQQVPNWLAYRAGFVNNRRIQRGVQFWAENARALDKATREYGVPTEIIVAIIGVETEYGRNMGNFNELNALASAGFYGERRREFFQSELEQYLLLARDNAMDLATTRGSFAGAMGIPQFMPSSQRRWGVDFDGDGRLDLSTSPVDAIGSVANFLKSHGWTPGETAVLPTTAAQPLPERFAKVDIKPGITLADYRDAGFTLATPLANETLATLVTLASPNAPTQYWLGLNNYYVITRYNRSAAYAMSVIQLGEAIRQARQNSP